MTSNENHHSFIIYNTTIIAPNSKVQSDLTNEAIPESKTIPYEGEPSLESDDSTTSGDSFDERTGRLIAAIEKGRHIGFIFDEDTGKHTIFAIDSAFLESSNDEMENVHPVLLNASPLAPSTPKNRVPSKDDHIITQVDQETEAEESRLSGDSSLFTPRYSGIETRQFNEIGDHSRAQIFAFAIGRLEGRLMPESPSPIKRYVNSTGVYSNEVEMEFWDTQLWHPGPRRSSIKAGLLAQLELAAENSFGNGKNLSEGHGNRIDDEQIERPANPTPYRAKYRYGREI